MSDLLTKIEREAILGNYSLRETFLLTDLDEPELKVIEWQIMMIVLFARHYLNRKQNIFGEVTYEPY